MPFLMQVKVQQIGPPTLRQAPLVSLEMESLCPASKQRLHTVREVTLEEEDSVKMSSQTIRSFTI